jgi:hypothetical protein
LELNPLEGESTMTRPVSYRRPDISRFLQQRVIIPSKRMDFEILLLKWLQTIVDNTPNPADNKGASRAMKLLDTAQRSIDVLMHLGPGMNLADNGRDLYLQVLWGRMPDGNWFVRAVSFVANALPQELNMAERDALRERLLDKAEAEYASRYHPRKIVFHAEDHVQTWTDDIVAGDHLLQPVIDRAYQHAKADAALMENPITATTMAGDLVGMGTGSVAGSGPGAKRLAGFYNNMWTGLTAKDAVDHYRSSESKGDKALYIGLDVLSSLPVAGTFVNTLAGMFFEIAIQNGAGEVTKIRCRAYLYFVAGYIQALTTVPTGTPITKFDAKYFKIGMLAAPSEIGGDASFKIQASLLHYASTHYTAGGWGGLSYIGHPPPEWTFPDEYIVNWSPELMGVAMATRLESGRYLYQ